MIKLGMKLRNLVSGRIGTLVRVEYDHAAATTHYTLRHGTAEFRLRASQVDFV